MRRYNYTDKDQIYDKLVDVITKGYEHPLKKRTVEIADYWYKMVHGLNQAEFVVSLRPTETEPQKQQRVRVYKTRTKYVINRLRSQIRKSDRVDYAIDQINYEGESAERKIAEIKDRLKCFAGKKNAKHHLNKIFLNLNETDPNAYELINFHPYDHINEKPYPYPEGIPSKYVVDWEYLQGELQYLIFNIPKEVKVVVNKKEQKGITDHYYIAAPNYIISLERIQENQVAEDREIVQLQMEGQTKTSPFYLTIAETKSYQVPAIRIGYTDDPVSNGAIKESIYYPIKEILEDIINKKSELDIQLLTHGIIHKFAYVPACNAQGCDNGRVHQCSGACDETKPCDCKPKVCSVCNGTGKKPYHTSSQDIITLELAFENGMEPEMVIDLEKLIHYEHIPEHIIKMYRDMLKELESDVSNAMFNTDLFNKDNTEAKTPEAIRAKNDALNNVLFDYATNKADIYKFYVEQTAMYMDQYEGLMCEFKPPTDFRLDSLDDLIAQYTATQGFPTSVRQSILSKIHHKQNQDSPARVMMIQAREKWKPMSHLSDVERVNALDMLPDDNLTKVLWLNFDRIFLDIEYADTLPYSIGEVEMKTKLPFYKISNHEVQKSILEGITKRYAPEVKSPQLIVADEETEL